MYALPPNHRITISNNKPEMPSEDYSTVMESFAVAATKNIYSYINKYNFPNADNFLQAALACRPYNSKIHELYALYYLQKEELDNALTSVKTAMRLNNTHGDTFLLASQIYRQMNKYDMAVRALEIALVCVPDTPANSDVRKLISDELAELKTETPPASTEPEPSASTSLFLPSTLSSAIIEVIISYLDYASTKKLEFVSQEWSKVVKNKATQQKILEKHTNGLINLLSLPKESITLAVLHNAFKKWTRLETNIYMREKLKLVMDIKSETLLNPSCTFAFHYDVPEQKEAVSQLPHDLLFLYSIHNGMKIQLQGALKATETYACTLYAIEETGLENFMGTLEAAPAEFRSKVRLHRIKTPILGIIEMSFCTEVISVLLDLSPLPDGTVGQLLIVRDRRQLLDVLPGGINQLLEYLTVLDTCNLVSAIGMFAREEADSNLPETLEETFARLHPKERPTKWTNPGINRLANKMYSR